MVTHNDVDHSGGARSVNAHAPAGALWSSLGQDHPAQGDAPYRLPAGGRALDLGRYRVRALIRRSRANRDPFVKANSRSCVLR